MLECAQVLALLACREQGALWAGKDSFTGQITLVPRHSFKAHWNTQLLHFGGDEVT